MKGEEKVLGHKRSQRQKAPNSSTGIKEEERKGVINYANGKKIPSLFLQKGGGGEFGHGLRKLGRGTKEKRVSVESYF